MALLIPKAGEADYVDFREDLTDKSSIKPAIEQNDGVRNKEARLKDTFESWWQQRGTHIAQLSGNGQQLSALRDELIGTFTHALEPIGMLGPFAVRGIIAGFWDQNKNEFRTLQARGVLGVVDAWRTSIITLLEDDQNKSNPLDHKLVSFLLADYVAELEDLQARKAELDARIKAATAQPDEDDDAEPDEDAPSEADIKAWKADRTKATKTLKAKQASLEAHLNKAVNALDEAGAAELMLTILHNDMLGILDTYIRQQRQDVIAAFETWWNKYWVTLADIEAERDQAAKELQGFLRGLGYA
jgi:type I restriction enzyme M protein